MLENLDLGEHLLELDAGGKIILKRILD